MSYIPTVSFQKYLKDGVETDISSLVYTVASGTFSGIDEDKYIYSVVIDPMELTTENVTTHELVFNISSNNADEGEYMSPMTWKPLSGTADAMRIVGVVDDAIQSTTWTPSLTSGSMIIDVDNGYEGSGSQAVITPDNGSTWSPPFGSSGSQVMDVPTIYAGSFTAIIDPASWDGVERLHDFQIVQAHVGHHVKVASWVNVASGVMVDNDITIWHNGSGDMEMDIMTYHEFPHKWELINSSGTLVQSGTQTYSLNQWLNISGLNFSLPANDITYTLKLYSSGTLVEYPTPLRTININIIVGILSRFGVGRFGLARFGL